METKPKKMKTIIRRRCKKCDWCFLELEDGCIMGIKENEESTAIDVLNFAFKGVNWKHENFICESCNGQDEIINMFNNRNFKIIKNAIRCTLCNDTIESEHVHDFKWCKCKSNAVDGGKDYLKRCGDTWEDMSEIAKDDE